jgi:altronate dehydratase small subunit
MESEEKAVVLNKKDNVALALIDLEAGSSIEVDAGGKLLTIKLASKIPFGHKFSLARIEKGAPVIKYGEAIGIATAVINAGDYVHVHNVVSTRGSTGAEGGAR